MSAEEEPQHCDPFHEAQAGEDTVPGQRARTAVPPGGIWIGKSIIDATDTNAHQSPERTEDRRIDLNLGIPRPEPAAKEGVAGRFDGPCRGKGHNDEDNPVESQAVREKDRRQAGHRGDVREVQ
jgi:hypothetical protein